MADISMTFDGISFTVSVSTADAARIVSAHKAKMDGTPTDDDAKEDVLRDATQYLTQRTSKLEGQAERADVSNTIAPITTTEA